MSNLFNKVIQGRQFNFQPLNFGHVNGYHVDVKDEEGTRWEFRMIDEDETIGKLEGENLPSWILELENELKSAISEHE